MNPKKKKDYQIIKDYHTSLGLQNDTGLSKASQKVDYYPRIFLFPVSDVTTQSTQLSHAESSELFLNQCFYSRFHKMCKGKLRGKLYSIAFIEAVACATLFYFSPTKATELKTFSDFKKMSLEGAKIRKGLIEFVLKMEKRAPNYTDVKKLLQKAKFLPMHQKCQIGTEVNLAVLYSQSKSSASDIHLLKKWSESLQRSKSMNDFLAEYFTK